MKKIYMKELNTLSRLMERTPNTPMGMYLKVIHLAALNMRYEKIAFNRKLPEHPYLLVRDLLRAQIDSFQTFSELLFIEDPKAAVHKGGKQTDMEGKHQSLFNMIWKEYDAKAYDRYVGRYKHRLKVNGLVNLVRGKRCLDFGCGNGNFCFALVESGAAFAAGIDFGPDSVAYANRARKMRGSGNKCAFKVASVYRTGYPSDSFDFVIQNGVFHHLENELKAIREARRVLKAGGWFWYYTDGEGGISYDLWDRSVHLLRAVPLAFMMDVLKSMNIRQEKITHLMDGLNATYRHTTWKKITGVLAREGFGEFRRLTGGFPTDFDEDVIKADPYGRAKFGEGDLRILARLVRK